MPCLRTNGIFVPAGTVIILPCEAALAECNWGAEAGPLFGVIGPSICCANRELPAKYMSTKRDSMGHLAKKFTATLDTKDIGGATCGNAATIVANRQRLLWDRRPSEVSQARHHWRAATSSCRSQILWGKTCEGLLLIRCRE